MTVILYVTVFLFGIVVGSFLNVCILRIPEKETIVTERSHCVACGHELAWYDLIPLFSYLFLKGRCRYCGERISAQYPLIEFLNGVLWCLTFLIVGWTWESVFICVTLSALVVISLIDWRRFEIPPGVVVFIGVVAAAHLVYVIVCSMTGASGDSVKLVTESLKLTTESGVPYTLEYRHPFVAGIAHAGWDTYVIGAIAVSGPMLLIYIVSRGRGIGGGDIKLMAAAGLLLGWKLILLALITGCFYACVIHLIRMKVSKEGNVLALGPYLSAGILTAMWFGEAMLKWYEGFFAG